MNYIPQVAFILLIGFATWLFARNISFIRRNILLGRKEDMTDQKSLRWKNVLFLAFGQKKMFRNPLVAIMHFIIYAGFIIINIEVLEIILDGILGTHRLFLGPLGNFYPVVINTFEWLAVGVIAVCIAFLVRRNIIKLKRFISHDLDGWPRSDANYILISEIILMSLFLTMNATDRALQLDGAIGYHNTGDFAFSGYLSHLLYGTPHTQLIYMERAAWWFHIAGIFAFLNYLPYSKHLHILLAFPNAYYQRLEPMGKMDNMEQIEKEVKLMLEPQANELPPDPNAITPRFGAKDVTDLSWKSLLDAYSCTECGRCTAACPANITGKLLSPRKIMMDTRDRLEEVGKNINENGSFKEDGKSLLRDYITVEELRACTACNACVMECPVSINPLTIILELRRNLIMEESNAPAEWNTMFGNIENNFAPWKFSPDERDRWASEMNS